VEHKLKSCPICKKQHTRRHSYCLDCHSSYMKKWRKDHPLTEEQRLKDNCRSYAGVYLRRGKIQKLPCENCGEENAQMHHEDYRKPLEVTWLCRKCHLHLHKQQEQ
jgi:hypothetical protein